MLVFLIINQPLYVLCSCSIKRLKLLQTVSNKNNGSRYWKARKSLYTHTHSHTLTPTHSHTHTYTLSHSHLHTHTLTLTHSHSHTHIQILNRMQQNQSLFNNDYLSGSYAVASFFLPKVKFHFQAFFLQSGRERVKGVGKGWSPYSSIHMNHQVRQDVTSYHTLPARKRCGKGPFDMLLIMAFLFLLFVCLFS